MLDINFIRNNIDQVKLGCEQKNIVIDFKKFLKLDKERRELISKVDKLREEKNNANNKIANLEKTKKQEAIQKMKKVAELEKTTTQKLNTINQEFEQILLAIPNIPSNSTPIGKDESENVIIKQWGKINSFSFQPKDHVALGEITDTIEIEAARISSGSRFGYLKNEAVLLQFGLIQHILKKLTQQGFIPVVPPVLVREESMIATGFFPADKEQIYHVNPEDDDLYLAGTSEVPLTMLHYNHNIPTEKLPIRYVGYSTCFRREAGTYGKDTSGILRVHQFDKLEMYSFCHPDKSETEHEFIRTIEEEIMQDLNLPYQVVNICSGDLGNPATKKYDIEVWIPSQNKYRELTSTSNCTNYQARRAKIKYKQNDKTDYLHTLNGTASAIGRTLIAIYENHQNQDGSITVPKVLQEYTLTDTILPKKTQKAS